MNILTFKYTKADGSISNRVLATMIKPNTMYEGIDISSLEPVDQVMFAESINTAYNVYMATLEAVKAEFDVTHDYRRFDPKKMAEVVSEVI
jgi:predicted lipoprotein